MRRIIRSLKFGFSEAAGFGGFFFWRGLERCLGVVVLNAVARTYYLCRATFNELFKKAPLARVEPEWLRTDGSLRSRIRRRRQKYHNYLLQCFPDRLGRPEWRSCCRLEGLEHLRAARQAGRPVVLAFFHFGPIYIMRQWVRAHGFPAAVFVAGELEARNRLLRFRDRLTPFPEVPVIFYPRELRALTKFLAGGNILLIAVDMPVGRQTTAETDDGWELNMNSGAARLANRAGADLIPVSIVTEGPWRFRMKFGQPIAGKEIPTGDDQTAANNRLLQAVLPDFKSYPEQFDLPRRWKKKENGTKNIQTG